jgi:hypothetical protein
MSSLVLISGVFALTGWVVVPAFSRDAAFGAR